MSNTNQISAHDWLEISAEYYEEILNAVPPIAMTSNKFICSEPYNTNDDDEDLYFVGCINSAGYFGRYLTIREYQKVYPYMITSELRHESVMLISDDRVKAYKLFLENEHRSNNEESREQFVERFKGEYEDQKDYTESNYQEHYPDELPHWVTLHLDFESLAMTLFCNHNIYYLNDSESRKIYVFDNP